MLTNSVVSLPVQPLIHTKKNASSSSSYSSASSCHGVAQQQCEPGKDCVEQYPPQAPQGPTVQQPPILPPVGKVPNKGDQTQQGKAPNFPEQGGAQNNDTVQFGHDNVAINDIYLSQQLSNAVKQAMEPGLLARMKSVKQMKKLARTLIKNPPTSDLGQLLNAVRMTQTAPAAFDKDSHVLDAATAVKVAGVQEGVVKSVNTTSSRVLARWARATVAATPVSRIKAQNRPAARNLLDVTNSFVKEALAGGHLGSKRASQMKADADRLQQHRRALG